MQFFQFYLLYIFIVQVNIFYLVKLYAILSILFIIRPIVFILRVILCIHFYSIHGFFQYNINSFWLGFQSTTRDVLFGETVYMQFFQFYLLCIYYTSNCIYIILVLILFRSVSN